MYTVRLALVAAAATCALTLPPVQTYAAEAFPARPIKLVVPFSPGGATDLIARVVGNQLQADFGQPVIVENRSGGNSIVGTQFVARAKPDGYTIVLVTGANLVVSLLQSDVPYDLIRDFKPIVGIGGLPMAFTIPAGSGIASVSDLVKSANASKNGLNYSAGGVGSLGHLTGAMFARAMNIKATNVPYRGNVESTQAVASHQVDYAFGAVSDVLPFAKAGKLAILSVTSKNRIASLPDTPTMQDLGVPDLVATVWYGFLAPAGTPDDVTARLRQAIVKAVGDAAVQEKLKALTFETDVTDAAQFAEFMGHERTRWKKVIDANEIRVN